MHTKNTTREYLPGTEPISVFFPAYNDAPSLPGLLKSTFGVLRSVGREFEVVVVNDGSRDDTASVLERLSALYGPQLVVVTHPVNRGYGGALQSGFRAARYPLVFYTDGDAQYDVAELPQLLRLMDSQTALVNGYKKQRADAWHRALIGGLYQRFVRFAFGLRIRDVDCDFRLIRRDCLDPEALTTTSGAVCVHLALLLQRSALAFHEVPVTHLARQFGQSQFFRWRPLWNTWKDLLRLYLKLVLLPERPSRQGISGTRVSVSPPAQ